LLLLSYLLSIRAILCLLDESFSMCLLLQWLPEKSACRQSIGHVTTYEIGTQRWDSRYGSSRQGRGRQIKGNFPWNRRLFKQVIPKTSTGTEYSKEKRQVRRMRARELHSLPGKTMSMRTCLGNAEISGLTPKRNRQQCSQCGNSATRCNHMRWVEL
jgi:hypothetical protein